jgi:hypothetical protein
MTTDERLFAWFEKHPEALPEGWVLTHSLKTPTHLFLHLSWIDDGTRLALTMALLRWVSERDHEPCLIVHAPGVYSGQWTVGYGRHGEEMSAQDLLAALLNAAEALEGDE